MVEANAAGGREGFRAFRACSGRLIFGEHHVDVEFDVSWDLRGEILLEFRAILRTKETASLWAFCHGAGIREDMCRLEGETQCGLLLRSDAVALTSSGERNTRQESTMQPESVVRHLEVRRANEESPSTRVVYQVVGLRSRPGLVSVDSPLGTLTIQAPARVDDFGRVTGLIAVDCLGDGSSSDETHAASIEYQRQEVWLEACDDLVRRVLLALSFAEGRLLKWSIREEYTNGEFVAAELRGAQATSNPFQPVLHHLDIDRVVELGVSNLTADLERRTGIDVAIEWSCVSSAYEEVRLLACMTALEHLVSTYSDECKRDDKGRGILSPALFKNLNLELKGTLNRFADRLEDGAGPVDGDVDGNPRSDEPDAVRRMSQALGWLNKPPLKVRLRDMLRSYGVVADDIEDDVNQAINARNDVVHRGLYTKRSKGGLPLREHVAVIRELLRRVVLTLLDYRGTYQSWLHGLSNRALQRLDDRPVE